MITNNKPCLTHLVQFIFLYNISQFIKISYFTFALWPKSVFDQLRSMMDNAHQMHDCTVYTCIIQNCMYVTFVRLKIAVIHNICYCYKINKKNVIFVLKTYFLQDFKLLPHDLSALPPPPSLSPCEIFYIPMVPPLCRRPCAPPAVAPVPPPLLPFDPSWRETMTERRETYRELKELGRESNEPVVSRLEIGWACMRDRMGTLRDRIAFRTSRLRDLVAF